MWYELCDHGVDRIRRIGEEACELGSPTWADESIVEIGYLWMFIRHQESFSERQELARVAASNIGRLSIKVSNRGWWPATRNGIHWTRRVALTELDEVARASGEQKSTRSLTTAITVLRDIGLGIAAWCSANDSEEDGGNGKRVVDALSEIQRRAGNAPLASVERECKAAIGRLRASGRPFSGGERSFDNSPHKDG